MKIVKINELKIVICREKSLYVALGVFVFCYTALTIVSQFNCIINIWPVLIHFEMECRKNVPWLK